MNVGAIRVIVSVVRTDTVLVLETVTAGDTVNQTSPVIVVAAESANRASLSDEDAPMHEQASESCDESSADRRLSASQHDSARLRRLRTATLVEDATKVVVVLRDTTDLVETT